MTTDWEELGNSTPELKHCPGLGTFGISFHLTGSMIRNILSILYSMDDWLSAIHLPFHLFFPTMSISLWESVMWDLSGIEHLFNQYLSLIIKPITSSMLMSVIGFLFRSLPFW